MAFRRWIDSSFRLVFKTTSDKFAWTQSSCGEKKIRRISGKFRSILYRIYIYILLFFETTTRISRFRPFNESSFAKHRIQTCISAQLIFYVWIALTTCYCIALNSQTSSLWRSLLCCVTLKVQYEIISARSRSIYFSSFKRLRSNTEILRLEKERKKETAGENATLTWRRNTLTFTRYVNFC